MHKVLCGTCLKAEPAAIPLDFYSADGCDTCDDGIAGHQVYDVSQ